MRVLAIESSCDESSLGWLDDESGQLRQLTHTQMDMHAAYGGVVPDLASREHLRNLPELLKAFALEKRPTHLVVTHGPGLAGCLALGIGFAQSLSLAWGGLPLWGVNHLHGHAYSPFIGLFEQEVQGFAARFESLLPHLGLVVSGGNTLLFCLDKTGHFEVLAQTVDDAAGEALDKGAKLMGLGYPGGPIVERMGKSGSPVAFEFPRAFAGRAEMKFSFSGLKTSLRYRIEAMDDAALSAALPDLCASYQAAVVAQLVTKTDHVIAAHTGAFRSVGLSGGVSNNASLRASLGALCQKRRLPLYLARPEHTGDNAAMIAFAAWMRRDLGARSPKLEPSLSFSQA